MKRFIFLISFTLGFPELLMAEMVPRNDFSTYAEETNSKLGFSKDYFSFSFFYGGSLGPPSGSFIDAEKDYDRNLLNRIQSGEIKRNIVGMPAISTYDRPIYQSNGLFGIELESGWTDYLGYGFTFQGQSVHAVRQRVQKQIHFALNEDVTTLPKDVQVYSDVSALTFLSVHPLPKNKFDPYMKLKAGMSFPVSDNVHASSRDDYFARNSSMTNGRGFSWGLGIGANYHPSPKYFYMVEFYKQSTRIYSDQFTGRILNTFYLQFGVGIRLALNN
ncbi:hypothetical protein EHQ81_12625 [Leptospira selangorensis]|uniref:Outer membrane protein beta-barrel domain-containing protein n=1 Tax=Leptospira selangorensis TaxID=2484982 RepID=A0A5F2C6P3_9LEPT|nr:hypothetical protein [Leptospira selangorensis]TGM12731.1 hypothetical protein EHQ81_12625 [Leptospira selangorensis]TGM30792.1 hypothetical protein EHQ82_00465 [Leptospira selangorensis]